MTIHLRQVCLVARELEPVIEQLSTVFDIPVCHRDPVVAQYGLENALMCFGTDFLEVVAPIADNTAASRYLNRLGGDGGYMVITQVDSVDTQQAIRARAIAARVRVAHEEKRKGWSFCQLHPADMEAAFLDIEYDEQADYAGCWHPAGAYDWQNYVSSKQTISFEELELQANDPLALTRLWRDVLGTGIDERACEITLANAKLIFREKLADAYPCLSGITVKVSNKQEIMDRAQQVGCLIEASRIEICGTQFTLRD